MDKVSILFSDLDGTLLHYENNQLIIHKENIKKIKLWQEENFFTVATGRNLLKTKELIGSSIKLNAPAVLSNGAHIYDFNTDTEIFKDLIPASFIKEILDFAKKKPSIIPVFTEPEVFYTVLTFDKSVVKANSNDLMIVDEETLFEKQILKVSFRINKNEFDAITKEVSKLKSFDKIHLTSSSRSLIEFVSKGINKASGIKKVLEYMNKKESEAAVIGDYLNDYEMIDYIKNNAVPENGCIELKEIAQFITVNNNEGAVADYITRLIKINKK